MSTPKKKVAFVIHGEPVSKANSRQLVTVKGRPRFIKSKKGLAYAKLVAQQCPNLDPPFDVPVRLTATLYYASRRPDLDESLLLDGLQSQYARIAHKNNNERACVRAGVYRNDRQVKEKHIFWGLDKNNPRAEVCVEEL